MFENSIPRGQKRKPRTFLTLDTLHIDLWEISVLVCGVLVYSGLWVGVCHFDKCFAYLSRVLRVTNNVNSRMRWKCESALFPPHAAIF